jgi:hypothetical protein
MDLSFSPASAGFLVGLLFEPEDEGHKFLRNSTPLAASFC